MIYGLTGVCDIVMFEFCCVVMYGLASAGLYARMCTCVNMSACVDELLMHTHTCMYDYMHAWK